jgi:adenine-specific DNA methylase
MTMMPMTSETSRVPRVSALEIGFPAVMLSEVGTKESWRKEVHRPATSTHKWWAKRLGTVFRGILLSAFIGDDADAVETYSSPFDLDGAVVLDPFAGSGVTAVEVLKAGGRAVSFDINPVATLVQRQAVAPWNLADLNSAFSTIEKKAKEEVDRVHRAENGDTVLYYFWVALAACPSCKLDVRLFDSPVFSKNAYPKRVPRAQVVCPECLDVQCDRYDFTSLTCSKGHKIDPQGAVRGGKVLCQCGSVFRALDGLEGTRPRFEMYAKLVVSDEGEKYYESISEWDRNLYAECEQLLAQLPTSAVLPVGELSPGVNTSQALNWNFSKWSDFFNARQLYSLSLIGTAIRDLNVRTETREALCALFSGTLEFNNMFASFKGEGTGAVRHMFANHVLKPERTPLEAHPWGTRHSSGSFSTLFESRLIRAHEYKAHPADLVVSNGAIERSFDLSKPVSAEVVSSWSEFASRPGTAYVATMDSAKSDLPASSVDAVITDPPFMDNVQYAELADFFHAWLRSMKPFEGYADTETTRSSGEVQNVDAQRFGQALEDVWRECERVLKPGGLLAFTYHQARMDGWVMAIEALRNAGFVVTSVQPVKGEMSTSIVKAGAREPSNLDSVVVCRRLRDGLTGSIPEREVALNSAIDALRRLQHSGVPVGAGDVRSVVRGTLLANAAAMGETLSSHADSIDEVVNGTINAMQLN